MHGGVPGLELGVEPLVQLPEVVDQVVAAVRRPVFKTDRSSQGSR